MNTLLQQLIELTGRLATAAGAAADSLASLRRFLAAWLIQQNPGFAPVVADPDADPELMQAAREGEVLASELERRGISPALAARALSGGRVAGRTCARRIRPFYRR